MKNVMTPSVSSETTDQQIEKVADVLSIAVRKHRKEFPSDAMQQALGTKGLARELLGVVRKYIEMFVNMIVRAVTVDRSRTPEQALVATNRKQYTEATVVASMPKGMGEETKVIFFQPEESAYDEYGWISDDNLEKEFEARGLKSADPYSLAAVNEADPSFADEHPNATHWKDFNGKWCYAVFGRSRVARGVGVGRSGGASWDRSWWFAGLAK